MSHTHPNRSDRAWIFTVEIKSPNSTATEQRTIYAASRATAEIIIRSALAVVYGVGRARVIGEPKEGR